MVRTLRLEVTKRKFDEAKTRQILKYCREFCKRKRILKLIENYTGTNFKRNIKILPVIGYEGAGSSPFAIFIGTHIFRRKPSRDFVWLLLIHELVHINVLTETTLLKQLRNEESEEIATCFLTNFIAKQIGLKEKMEYSKKVEEARLEEIFCSSKNWVEFVKNVDKAIC